MPNWCHSVLEISGPKDEIASIAKTGMDFEKIIPIPADLIPGTYDLQGMSEFQIQSNEAIYGYESWYYWCIDKWGTKWTAYNKSFNVVDQTRIDVSMDTAWSMPMGILNKLSSDHPNTTIRIVDCEEESGLFVGDFTLLGGKIIEDNVHEPSRDELIKRGMIDRDGE